jgi:hypothetical protein
MQPRAKRLYRIAVQQEESKPERTMYFTSHSYGPIRVVMRRFAKRFPNYFSIDVRCVTPKEE